MKQNTYSIEISIVEIISVIKSKVLQLMLISLSLGVLTYVYLEYIKKDVYQSEGTVIMNFSNPISTIFGDYTPNSSKISDFLSLLNNQDIGLKTLKDLNLQDSISTEQLNKSLSYVHDISVENNSVKIMLSLEDKKANLILLKYIENFISLLNSTVGLKALDYFEKELEVTTTKYEIRNEELKKEIKQIEELMDLVNRGVPKSEINSLQKEGVLINLSDVLNENYLLLEKELIENKRQLFNYLTKMETFDKNIEKIKRLKNEITQNNYTSSAFDIIHDRITVLLPQQETTASAISKSSVPKSIAAFIVGLGFAMIYFIYRHIASLHYAQKQ